LCTYTDIVLGDAPNNAQKSPVSKLTQSWVRRYRTTLNSGQELNHPKWNNDHASCQENFELEDSGRCGAKNRPKMGCWNCFFVGPCYCVPQMVAHVVYVIAWFNEKRPISWDFFFDFFFCFSLEARACKLGSKPSSVESGQQQPQRSQQLDTWRNKSRIDERWFISLLSSPYRVVNALF